MCLRDVVEIRSQVAQLWSDGKVCEVATPEDYWKMLTDFIRMTFSEQGKGKQLGELFISDLTLRLLHPRLDAHVSIQLNHLLKSPFCIHPGTGTPLSESTRRLFFRQDMCAF